MNPTTAIIKAKDLTIGDTFVQHDSLWTVVDVTDPEEPWVYIAIRSEDGHQRTLMWFAENGIEVQR